MMTSECGRSPFYHRERAVTLVARHPGPWLAFLWAVVLLTGPLVDAVVGGQPLRVLSVLALALVYLIAVTLPFRTGPRTRVAAELVFVGLLLCGAGYFVAWRTDSEFVYPLLAIAAAIALRERWALGMIMALTISGSVATGIEQGSLNAALLQAFATVAAGLGSFLVLYLVDIVNELTRAQERIARSAVAEERLRFSRDLHDLLGHTLSVIVVKAEAIRRLVSREPAAAADHAADIESIGRTALREVRDAVTGYRAVSLADELAAARSALTADGTRARVTGPQQELPADVDSLLGWVVREGTTNVLRHAEATTCTITVTVDDTRARVDVVDNGSHARLGPGAGLQGLQERLSSAGGVLTTTASSSGFRLSASVPTSRDSGDE